MCSMKDAFLAFVRVQSLAELNLGWAGSGDLGIKRYFESEAWGGDICVDVHGDSMTNSAHSLWQRGQFCEKWHIKCLTWHVTHDTWHVTCERWEQVNLLSKFQLPSSYGLGGKGDMSPDNWHVTCHTWHVSGDKQWEVNIVSRFALTVWE